MLTARWGVGKSTLAYSLGVHAAGHPLGVELINGQDCTVDKVREWMKKTSSQAIGSTPVLLNPGFKETASDDENTPRSLRLEGDAVRVRRRAAEGTAALAMSSGAIVLDQIIERVLASGEDIYEMDISALKPGSYFICIPGFACSEVFNVGGQPVFEMYYHALRAFIHQRCGQEFKEPWTAYTKAACHAEIWESGEFVAGPGAIHHSPGNRDGHAHYEPKPGEKKMAMKGGYHDAADFDTFTYARQRKTQMAAEIT